ncbi:MAG: sigma-70 family RNA polymerase sigma factor [Povalibacter sp.]
MNESPTFLAELKETRQRFLELVAEIRPDLHRYCARMMGSVADGEDVVQEALARAYYQLPELHELPALRAWLFRIAHNQALDLLRKRERQKSESIEALEDIAMDEGEDAEAIIAREHAVGLAVSKFQQVSSLQRSCVILKDVLDYSLQDIARLLDSNVIAVKAALHRGRTRLREVSSRASEPERLPVSSVLRQYVQLFNARDWEGVRALLIEDVKLDLVSVSHRSGKNDVSTYFTNYGRISNWHLRVGWLEAQPIIAVFTELGDSQPKYFVELVTNGQGIASIRDFRYVPYITRDAQIEFTDELTP